MTHLGRIWIARTTSLAIFAALCALALSLLLRMSTSTSTVTIRTSADQAVILDKLKAAGIEATEISIQKLQQNPLAFFVWFFLLFGLAQAVFLTIHSTVKTVLMTGASNRLPVTD